MNTKKIIKRMLPVIIVLGVILVIGLACVLFPKKVSETVLGNDYAGKSYLELNGVTVVNDDVYKLLKRSYGDDAVAEIVDAYLMKNIKSVKDATKSYYDLAKADTEGVDKLITDEIFSSGRNVDKLDKYATEEDRAEAEKADKEAIEEWYKHAITGNNVSSLEELREIYVLKLAKKLYVQDYLTDDYIYDLAVSELSVLDKYVSFAVDYVDDVLQKKDSEIAEFEKAVLALVDSYKEQILTKVNATYETSKVKSEYNGKKNSVIDNSTVAHANVCELETSKWNTLNDATSLDDLKEAFLADLLAKLNEAGATFASVSEMKESKYAPTVTDTYKSTYEAEFNDTYYVVYVEFNNSNERNNALAQLNAALVDYTLVHFDKYYEAYDLALASEEALALATDEDRDEYATDAALKTEGVKLSREEIVQLFIDLYNNYNSTFALDGEGNVVLDSVAIENKADLETLITWLKNGYGEEKGNGSNFNLEWLNDSTKEDFYAKKDLYDLLNKFAFTASELSSVNSTLATAIKSTLNDGLAYYDKVLGTDDEIKLVNTYSPTSSTNNLYVALKLGYTSGTAFGHSWADLSASEKQAKNLEYMQEAIDKLYTTSASNTTLAALRNANGLEIYDESIAKLYASSYDSTFTVSKAKGTNLVASLGELEITADDVFLFATSKHGITTILALYEQDWFINSKWSRLNDVYSNGKWLTKADLYDEVIGDALANVVNTYDYYNYYYAMYGYSTLSWEEFLENVYYYYGVYDTDSLKMFLVYQDAQERYRNEYVTLGSFENGAFDYSKTVKYNDEGLIDANGTNTLWDILYRDNELAAAKQLMSTIDEEYFGIKGFHVLIKLTDEDGNTVPASNWNELQTKLGKEFYDKIKAMANDWEPEKWQENWESFVKKFNQNLPVYSVKGLNQGDSVTNGQVNVGGATRFADLSDADYVYAVYKTLGFELVCESLSEITTSNASSYDKGFVDGIKTLYNGLMATSENGAALSNIHELNGGYISGNFGYHLYCATATSVAAKYSVTVNDEAKDLDYTYNYLTPEIIIYLAQTDAQLDDTLLALLTNTELNKVFSNWYSAEYAYEGYFASVVNAVRALAKATLSTITEADNENKDTYYVTAKSVSGTNDPLLYAQKEYLLDLLTKYYSDMIARYYTPVYEELNGSSTNTGYDYLVLATEVTKNLKDNANAFKLNGVVKTINFTESENAKFPVLHLDDENVTLTFDAGNGKTSYEFMLDHTIEEIIEDYTHVNDFCEEQVNALK